MANSDSSDKRTLLDHFMGPAESMLPKGSLIARKSRVRKSRSRVDAQLLNTQQAADYLGISEWTLRRLAHAGEIRFIRRKYFYFAVADLNAYIRENLEREL